MDSGIGIGGLSTGKDEYVTSAFDLFTSTEVENSIQMGHHLTYRPISVTAGAGPFNFEIPADPDKFTNAESIRLHGAIRIRKKIRVVLLLIWLQMKRPVQSIIYLIVCGIKF